MDLHDTRFLQREPLNQRLAERKAQYEIALKALA